MLQRDRLSSSGDSLSSFNPTVKQPVKHPVPRAARTLRRAFAQPLEALEHRVFLSASPAMKPTDIILRSVGKASDQADAALKASLARNTYNLSGVGVKVGIISDSIDNVGNGQQDSIATGDLATSATTLVASTGSNDTDEGRALMEEIHDLAPSATFYFASADNGQQAFADDVGLLVSAGCKVIVDDVGFTDEPFFQPGVIDQAINSAVAAGVSFVTASGNEGNNGFVQQAHWVPAQGSTDQLINFNPGGATATRMNVTIAAGGNLTMEWNDQYNGVTANVKSDLDIYLYNAAGNAVVYSATTNNFNGIPVETINNIVPGTYQVEIRAKNTTVQNLPTYYGFNGTFTISSTQYAGIRTTVIGHAGMSNAISVGAVPFYNVPPYSTTTPIAPETFSAQGPAIQTRDVNGNLLGSPITINKPDISGTDQNNTSFFGTPIAQTGNSLPSFAGTSAAAGNVAGVIALILQEFPNDTPAQILAALKATAVPVNGQVANTYNSVAGFGLVDAAAAIANLGAGVVAPQATIQPVVPNPTSSPVNSINVDFNEPVTGVKVSDFSLTLNGGSNLLIGSQATLSTNDGQHYVLSNLFSITSAPGTYLLTLRANGSGIVGQLNQPLTTDASTSWLKSAVFTVPNQPDKLSATALSQASIRLHWRDNANNENSYTVQRSTNPFFKVHVRSFVIPPNSNSYVDSGLNTGTRYYYRVFATNDNGDSFFSGTASDATLSRGEVILDNSDLTKGVSFVGGWTTNNAGSGFIGADYLQDDNSDKKHKIVTYEPKLLKGGSYFVYATWPRLAKNATSVPFSVFSSRGVLLQTVNVNERKTGGNGWVLIGKFALHSGAGASVQISNAGTRGEVIADAVQFLPANAIPGSKTG